MNEDTKPTIFEIGYTLGIVALIVVVVYGIATGQFVI